VSLTRLPTAGSSADLVEGSFADHVGFSKRPTDLHLPELEAQALEEKQALIEERKALLNQQEIAWTNWQGRA
jgi:hypothetical protein